MIINIVNDCKDLFPQLELFHQEGRETITSFLCELSTTDQTHSYLLSNSPHITRTNRGNVCMMIRSDVVLLLDQVVFKKYWHFHLTIFRCDMDKFWNPNEYIRVRQVHILKLYETPHRLGCWIKQMSNQRRCILLKK